MIVISIWSLGYWNSRRSNSKNRCITTGNIYNPTSQCFKSIASCTTRGCSQGEIRISEGHCNIFRFYNWIALKHSNSKGSSSLVIVSICSLGYWNSRRSNSKNGCITTCNIYNPTSQCFKSIGSCATRSCSESKIRLSIVHCNIFSFYNWVARKYSNSEGGRPLVIVTICSLGYWNNRRSNSKNRYITTGNIYNSTSQCFKSIASCTIRSCGQSKIIFPIELCNIWNSYCCNLNNFKGYTVNWSFTSI